MNETMENVKDIIETEEADITPVTDVDPTIAVAYADSEKNTKHIQEVKDELNKLADEANPEVEPEFGKMPENTYTKGLTLDESVLDDKKPSGAALLSDEDDMDDYLDYDMFDFIYGLVVAQTWPKPLNPLNHKIRTFQYTGEDDYLDTNSNKGVGQVGTEDNAIVVYSDNAEDFNDIKEVCELYRFKYEGPRAKRSPSMRWNFSFKIFVPMTTNNYPEMVEDYFTKIGLPLESVMPESFVSIYRKRQAKDKEALKKDFLDKEKTREQELNDSSVEAIYDKYVKKAGANGDIPLRDFIRDMFSEMEVSGLKFKRANLKKRFEDEFLDDFDDEEE